MSVSRDQERGTWKVYIRYKNWENKKKIHTKRGFKTKREALEYERKFLVKKTKDINMGFESFIDIYMSDIKPQIKYSTYLTKENIINSHIRPYFQNKALSEIDSTDILQWQNELLSIRDYEGKGYTQTYLRTIQNQLNAIMNHAVRYYGLQKSPCFANKKLGKSKAKEMLFWTKSEYFKFIETMKRKPISYYAFEILFWTGIREGELLALTKNDFDLENRILHITKTYHRIEKEDYITNPKTEKSNRDIHLPEFLCDELRDYFEMLYKCGDDMRVFDISKYYLHHEMDRGCKESGVKRIRIHDLRHSHVAYLIELGFSPIEIAERMGHESISVTLNYSHLYPSVQKDMATKLNIDRDTGIKKDMEE